MGGEVRCLWGGFVERQEASEMPDNANTMQAKRAPKGRLSAAW